MSFCTVCTARSRRIEEIAQRKHKYETLIEVHAVESKKDYATFKAAYRRVLQSPDLGFAKAGAGYQPQLNDENFINKMEGICSAPARTLDDHVRITIAAQTIIAHLARFEMSVQPMVFQLDVLRRCAELGYQALQSAAQTERPHFRVVTGQTLQPLRRCNLGCARSISAEDYTLFFSKNPFDIVGRQFLLRPVFAEASDRGVFYEVISATMDKRQGLLYSIHFEIYCDAIEVGVKEMKDILKDTIVDDTHS